MLKNIFQFIIADEMKKKTKIYSWVLLFISVNFLTGCPVVTYYKFLNQRSDECKRADFTFENCKLSLIGAHPWLEKGGKKFIIVNAEIENLSGTDTYTVLFSRLQLTSAIDSYVLNFSKEITANQYFMESNSVQLDPSEKRSLSFFFYGLKKYSGHSYNKSVKEDKLSVTVTSAKEIYYLIWSRRVIPL